MSKKNLVNVSSNPNPATKAIDKENVMQNGYYNEIESTIEGILITSILGLSLPLIVTFTDRLAMVPSDVAFLVILVHAFTACVAGVMMQDTKGTAKAIAAAAFTIESILVGTALFRCLVEGISNGLPVDYASLPAFVVTSATVALSFAVASAFASTTKK